MSYRRLLNTGTNTLSAYLNGTVNSTGVSGQVAYSETLDLSDVKDGEGLYIEITAAAAANTNLKGVDVKVGSKTMSMINAAINGDTIKLSMLAMEGESNSVLFRDVTGITDSEGYRADVIRYPKGSLFSDSTNVDVILDTTTASDLILLSVTIIKYEQ